MLMTFVTYLHFLNSSSITLVRGFITELKNGIEDAKGGTLESYNYCILTVGAAACFIVLVARPTEGLFVVHVTMQTVCVQMTKSRKA